jgi:hypothetical protein
MKFKLTLFFLLMDLVFILNINAQSKQEYIQYLKNNSLDMKDTIANWDLVLDSSFYKNDFYWIGETHAIKYSYDAQWALLKQIHKKVGFKYYLLEAGYISELFLNKYLETGDEKYLNMEFNATEGTMGYNIDAYEFYKKLYHYNQELSKDKKIEIVSIDIEHQYKETDKYIRSLFHNTDLPKDTSDFINVFLRSKEDYKNLYNKLYIDLSSDSAKYQMILKSDYSMFWYLVRNINYLFLARTSTNFNQTRDSLMFENYKIRLQTYDFNKSKVFAYFGTAHCFLEKTKNTNWIASLIKNSDPALKSTSLMMLYSDCKQMMPIWAIKQNCSIFRRFFINKNKDYVNVPRDDDWKNILKKSSKANYTLFNIINRTSTFKTSKLFAEDIRDDKFTTDYFQYFLLIKKSPASIPYGQ